MNPEIVQALARHALTAIGSGIAVKYGVDGATMDAVVGGVAALIGIIWSIVDKAKRKQE